ncbi:16S rRNA (guanine(527)-N(7))-methyltransferase RsmG [Actinotignum sanguinis]|uniref:Ribosomal RNA small subunit methyltransferase G n=3 Tax=Actinomycetaceae TaxID=2049 RepID=A0ABZ0RAI5_9ACTO|nr:16S rRNA (guanine(527)-N(7))-methyltransferase RsmG [Actinotignum sanguinis]WPJ88809.1 16S rRNA (guanine(527)-N(7))-methyltransferase RsmG [Schaalia turicensis]MDE1552961.1 16S rRNA (guanine(527)-N(7))-methyltransferase RsmG [Actinotignum sanguinis]MDE1576622.1 16S rRNA (guanine(527)-N(7))-methyltransferase RsmG [Actinotignum sanguinis]MDE1656578.1 16S rRNA (guanine(527)-N(7))-methyltransferase RsmG [Actinotignum sanguinis]MDK7197152.1 16S rRNA (guanine(527)-N(7))-methyltransferase RsmG [Ac
MAEEHPMIEVPPAAGAEHFGTATWGTLLHFARLLEEEGEVRGLVGPRELGRLWSRHLLNSLAIEEFIPVNATVGDVGSGAGFPGIVLAIVRPDVTVTLIESMERRTEWLRYVVGELGLRNVKVRTARAEQLKGRFAADIVTARAVAALKKLLPWTMPLVKPGGRLVALKGERAAQEIDDAAAQLQRYGAVEVTVHAVVPFGTAEATRVVEVTKKAS